MTGTRAVVRRIEAGGVWPKCPGCEVDIKYRIRDPEPLRRKVVCNVYVDGKWDRVEQWHLKCYEDAGSPHGEAA